MMLTSVSGKFLYCGSTRRWANSMYEQGTDSIIPSENWKEIESATVELCWRRPSGLTGSRASIQIIHIITKLQLAMIIFKQHVHKDIDLMSEAKFSEGERTQTC